MRAGPESAPEAAPSELRLRRLAGLFADAGAERSFRHHFETLRSTRRSVAHFCALLVFVVAVFVVASAAETRGSECGARYFMYSGAAACGAVAAFLCATLALGGLVVYSQEALALALCTAFTAVTLTMHWVCPLAGPSEEYTGGPTNLPPEFYAFVCQWYVHATYVFYGATVWPLSFAVSCAVCVPQLAVLAFLAAALASEYVYLFVQLALGWLFVTLFIVMSNLERRRDFASNVLLERQRRQVAAEKTRTNALFSLLFPRGIAQRLLDSRSASAALGNHADVGCSSASSFMSELSPSAAARQPLIVRSSDAAAVVCVRVDRLEAVGAHAEQLEALSRLFVAADLLAASLGAEKVKSVGATLMFAGWQQDRGRAACELAAEMQRVLRRLAMEHPAMARLALCTGISIGPAIAGVIGSSRPRYDVWGYTVNVAIRLSESAAPGQILVTKDISKNLEGAFTFNATKNLTVVHGVGRVMPVELVAPSDDLDSPLRAPLSSSGDPFVLARPVVRVLDVAKGRVPLLRAHVNPITLMFPSMAKEAEFMRGYTEKYYQHSRWLLLAMAVFYLMWLIRSLVVNDLSQSRPFVLKAAHIAMILLMFAWTFCGFHTRPLVFHAVMFALALCTSTLMSYMWNDAVWGDSLVSGSICWVTLLFTFRMPFYLAAPLGLAYAVSNIRLVVILHHPPGTAVFLYLWLVSWAYLGRSSEMNNRQLFSTSELLTRSREESEREQETARSLLTSVLPQPVLDRLASAQPPQGCPHESLFMCEFVSSGTVLVSNIPGFEGLYQRMQPEQIVAMLNSLFSHFDSLATARGLTPLRTNADEYVVAANMLNDVADHVQRVAGLAVDMVATMDYWNTEHNCTSLPIALAGVIKTKPSLFDCWGDAIPFARKVCECCPLNAALLSDAAATALEAALPAAGGNEQFFVQPFRRFSVGGRPVMTHLLHSKVAPLPTGDGDVDGDDSDTPEDFALPYVPVGGIDYGVLSTDPTDSPPSPADASAAVAVLDAVPGVTLCLPAGAGQLRTAVHVRQAVCSLSANCSMMQDSFQRLDSC
eukprot:m51a1_g8261 hypothetical protein (1050) ;mRNA; r:11511-15548